MANELQSRSDWWRGNHFFYDETVGGGVKSSLRQLLPHAMKEDPAVAFNFLDDFCTLDVSNTLCYWRTLTEDAGKGGTDAVQDAIKGIYRLYCDGDDNDEAYVHGGLEAWQLENGKYFFWEARVKLTEGNTNQANFIVGLMENVAAASLQDNGGGPPADYDGMVWYKVDATMELNFETALSTAHVTQTGLITTVSGRWYRVGAFCKPASATTFSVYPFYYDETTGNPTLGSTANTLTLTGHGPLELVFGVKQGNTSGTEEYIEIDYFWVCQER